MKISLYKIEGSARKCTFFILFSLFVFLIIFHFWLRLTPAHIWIPNPFKIIDPSDPEFEPMEFKFSDYRGKKQIDEVLKKMFPEGTHKQMLDRLFVDHLNMQEAHSPSFTNSKDHYSVYYVQHFKRKNPVITGRYVWVVFTSNNKLKKIVGFNYTDFKGATNPPGINNKELTND